MSETVLDPDAPIASFLFEFARNRAANTLRAYEAHLYSASAWLREQRDCDVFTANRADLQAWLDSEAVRGMAANSIAQRVSALRTCWTWLRDNGFVEIAWADDIHPPGATAVAAPHVPLSEDHLLAIETSDFAWTGPNPGRARSLLLLALHGGLKQGQIERLTWSDIDLDRGLLLLDGTIELTPELRASLTALRREGRREGRVFPITSRSMQRIVCEAREALGLPDGTTVEKLRTAHLQRRLAAGQSPEHIRDVVGYANTNVARRALGLLRVEERVCAACGGGVDLGPLAKRCADCLGTGILVQPPPGYVATAERRHLQARIAALGTEMRRVAEMFRQTGYTGRLTAHQVELGGKWVTALARSMAGKRRSDPVEPDEPKQVLEQREVTQRLRANGRECRKDAMVMLELGFISATDAQTLGPLGANLDILAYALEEGHECPDLWLPPTQALR